MRCPVRDIGQGGVHMIRCEKLACVSEISRYYPSHVVAGECFD